jgi:phosphoglycolate phosphatase
LNRRGPSVIILYLDGRNYSLSPARLRLGRNPDGLDRHDRGLHPGDGLPEQTIRGTIGLGLRETIDILSPGCDDELYERILDSYRTHWHSTYRDMPLLFDGVGEMLRDLSQEGYLLAIATGKSRRGLDYALDQTGLRGFFHTTRTVDEAFSKPHPQMLLDILDEMGVPPREAVMIGDTTYDLEMARNARTGSVGVCSGGHCREELERFGPLACLDDVIELAPWLAKRAVTVET